MELKRVVITGMGALTPLGNNLNAYWDGLINGVSGAAPIQQFDASKFKTQFACEIKNFNVEDFIDRKEARKLDQFSHYGSHHDQQAAGHQRAAWIIPRSAFHDHFPGLVRIMGGMVRCQP
jgi:3-oxoacyl-(acyl-carrier-protein) synthase